MRAEIGESQVIVKMFNKPGWNALLFNLHNNEQTSLKAAWQVVENRGGNLLWLEHAGSRHVTFSFKGEQFRFDPNRIFSKAGVRCSLALQSKKGYSKQSFQSAAHLVDQFAQKIISKYLSAYKLIIALHNCGRGGYSLKDYQSGGVYSAEASAVYQGMTNAGNFYFVNEVRNFNLLKSKQFNVVLQDNQNVSDDGSLSVYCAKNQQVYFNVEALHYEYAQQVEMIDSLYELC